MSVLSAIVDFLRVGYPEGVPQQDYIPLLALLRRQLSDEEVPKASPTCWVRAVPTPKRSTGRSSA
jgi:hypothetical protein